MSFCMDEDVLDSSLFEKKPPVALDILVFLSTLLIGADVFGIKIGVNLRLDQVFLALSCLCLWIDKSYDFKIEKTVLSFLLCGILSTVFAFQMKRSLLYLFSIFFNIYLVYNLYSNTIKYYGFSHFQKIFRATFYCQFFIFLLQVGLKVFFDKEIPFMPSYGTYFGIPRFSLWFYEPSYLATYLVFYFGYVGYLFLFKERKYLIDFVLCLVQFVLCTATTGFLGVALTLVCLYFLYVVKGNKISFKIAIPALLLIGFILFRFAFSNLYKVFIGRIFDDGLSSASGGRIDQYKVTFSVFMDAPLFGVGMGNYGRYLGLGDVVVPTNVTLDLLSTMGLFGFLSFSLITLQYFFKISSISLKAKNDYCALVFGLFLFTIVLQANQGYLRLYHWMFFGILQGVIKYQDSFISVDDVLSYVEKEEQTVNLKEILERDLDL